MKKLLITAAVAALALTSCTSDNDDYGTMNERQVISFSQPVIHGVTRAHLGEIDGVYPTAENFRVYGVKYPATGAFPGWNGTGAEQVYTAAGEEASYKSTLNGWFTTNQHIFDNTKKYAFGAYSPSSVTTTGTAATSGPSSAQTVTYDATGLNITNYYIGDMESQSDLMFSERKYDVKADYNMNQGGATEGNDGNTNATYNGVNLKFRHALSSIHFRAFVDPKFMQIEKDVYNYTVKTGDFEIKSIAIKGINTNGNFKENIQAQGGGYTDAPEWTGQSNMPAEGVYFFNALKKMGGDPQNDCVNLVIQPGDINSDETTLSNDKNRDITKLFTGDDITLKGQAGLMMPQTFQILNDQPADAADAYIEILWNHNFVAGGVPQTNEMKTIINLKDYLKQWEIGKRYVFILIFRGNLIHFNPVIEDWTDENTNITN